MGYYFSVSGSVELYDGVAQFKALIAANVDENPYIESWLVHEAAGGLSYAFFGHVVRGTVVDAVRSQLQRIATQISSIDGEYVDHPVGLFRAVGEDHELIYEWEFRDGVFRERKLPEFERWIRT